MAITAKDVAELRQRTGAGMMDCKKALEENNGDMTAAIEYLRKKGIAKAEKRADRSTSEGIVGGDVFNHGTSAALIEVACETDFVARNEDFGKIVTALLAHRVQSTAADIEAFLAEPMTGSPSESVEEYVKAAAAKTGEAVNVKRTVRFDAGANGQVGMYRHHNGKLATIVQVTASSPEVANHEATKELVKYIAEHVAASAPIAVDRSGVPAEKLEAERRVAEGQARETGKPEAMIEKIATGKVEAYLKDVTLMPQPWVRDAAITIAQLVADHGKKAGGAITVDRFARLQLGAE
ncbi:translation elongation factor Ts [Gemmatimonas sp.]|jgi:elongation factor Ts|uniref:translation elongation factor Ts n=1 Tax=Gemmatimonas sp. TaxID=1962908 RepID=UPI0022C036D7|nr:translation elongation factor Ts [Gemmatimonas sp.]MCA2984403.1 elongation factor Ts [Gemmatimonas sp.]MCA2988181.1 elongation factor Ts [Gemmatimonas sp.]MCA2990427.1 elongation factor Ts [Gemmatimonas sp.]MCA2994106.1 elongation factor Ts [Gemmatimonas sp.]MCE2954152.1 translation elongation factor Ts [Gemmatimonas sp.]